MKIFNEYDDELNLTYTIKEILESFDFTSSKQKFSVLNSTKAWYTKRILS